MKTLSYVAVFLIGYLLGCLNPAALIGRLKNKNLREHGTGNLGATNVMLNFGKRLGALVMLFDIAKAVIAVALAKALFPELLLAGLLAGGGAVVGHIFPFYLRFKGGKGLAAYGGMILALDPPLFLFLLVVCGSMMLLFDYSVAMVISAAILFPVIGAIRTGSVAFCLTSAAISALLVFCFRGNIKKIRNGEEIRVRVFLKERFSNEKNKNTE